MSSVAVDGVSMPLTVEEMALLREAGEFGCRNRAKWDATVDAIKARRHGGYPPDWPEMILKGRLFGRLGDDLAPVPKLKLVKLKVPKAGSTGSAAYWGITGMCEVVLTEQGRTMARSMGISESDSKQRLLCMHDPAQDRIKLYGDLGGAFSVERNEPDLIEAWYKLKGRDPMPPAVSVDRE